MIRHERLFRATADATRRRLLHLLRHGEHCVGDLIEILEMPQPTVSRHLSHLRAADLVTARRDSPWVHYSLAIVPDPVREALLAAVYRCADDPIVKADRERAEALAKTGGCCPSAALRAKCDAATTKTVRAEPAP